MQIGYHNVLNDAGVVVSASSEAVGFEKENAYDNRTTDYWKPTAVPATLKATGKEPLGFWLADPVAGAVSGTDADITSNANDLTANGTVTKSPVASGSGVMGYSGFSESNYLEQPYNSDLDFGTDDWCFAGWAARDYYASGGFILSRGYYSGGWVGANIVLYFLADGTVRVDISDDGAATIDSAISSVAYDDGSPHFIAIRRNGSNLELVIDTVLVDSTPIANAAGSLSNALASLMLGNYQPGDSPLTNGTLAPWRAFDYAPTAAEIKAIYDQEKWYFEPNAVAPANLLHTSATTADYFAVYAHDLAQTGASVVLQFSDDDSAWTNAFDPIYPVDSSPIFKTFTQSSHKYWQALVDGSVQSIGVISFGKRLDFERGLTFGYAPPHLAQQYMPIDSVSREGEFIGRSVVKKPISASLVFNPTFTRAWIRQYWPEFMRHAERYPFFVLPENTEYPDEALFAWVDRQINTPSYQSIFMKAEVPLLCRVS